MGYCDRYILAYRILNNKIDVFFPSSGIRSIVMVYIVPISDLDFYLLVPFLVLMCVKVHVIPEIDFELLCDSNLSVSCINHFLNVFYTLFFFDFNIGEIIN